MKVSINILVIFIHLVISTTVVSQTVPRGNFSVYSAHIPYSSEKEALTYKEENSSYVFSLKKSWNHGEVDSTMGIKTIHRQIDFPLSLLDIKKLSEKTSQFFSKEVTLPKEWLKEKAILHLSNTSVDYKIAIDDSILSNFNPLPGFSNEIDVTEFCQAGVLKIIIIFKTASMINEIPFFENIFLYTTKEVHITELNVSGRMVNGQPWAHINMRRINYSSKVMRNYVNKISIYDETNHNLVGNYEDVSSKARGVYPDSLLGLEDKYYSFGCQVYGALWWTAETPNRYRMTIQVKDSNDSIVEVLSAYIAFRKLNILNEKIFINQYPIKLKGINYSFEAKRSDTIIEESIEREIVYLKSKNINAIKIKTNSYASTISSLCDEYGLYVIIDVDDFPSQSFSEEALRNQFFLLQNRPSVIAWYSNSFSNLRDSLEAMNRKYRVFKEIHVVRNFSTESKTRTLEQFVMLADFKSDTTQLKRILSKSSSYPIILETDVIPDSLNKIQSMVLEMVNNKTSGIGGLFPMNFKHGDSIPNKIFRMYQPIGFEEVSKGNATYSIINYLNFTNTDSIEFRFRLSRNNQTLQEGVLPDIKIKPWKVAQVILPIEKENRFNCGCTVSIMAMRKKNEKNQRRAVIASTQFDYSSK